MPGDEHYLSWLLPELRRFASPNDAQNAIDRFSSRLMKNPRVWLALFFFPIAAVVLVMFSEDWLVPTLGAWEGILASPIVPAASFGPLLWFSRRGLRRFLRQQLIARGIPICIKCGYNLTGNESGTCPECGTRT